MLIEFPDISVENSKKDPKWVNFQKLYDPFLWMGFNLPKATEPLQGGSLVDLRWKLVLLIVEKMQKLDYH